MDYDDHTNLEGTAKHVQSYANKWLAYVYLKGSKPDLKECSEHIENALQKNVIKSYKKILLEEYLANTSALIKNLHNQPIMVVDSDGNILMSIA